MKNFLKTVVRKYGAHFCALALMVAPMTSSACRWLFYQPEEPEGLDAFVNKMKEGDVR